jgi:hypothetical protein
MITLITHHIITHLAAGPGGGGVNCTSNCGAAATSQFLNTPLGGAVGDLLSALGILLVIVAVAKGAIDAFGGKLSKSFKVVFGVLILAIFMIEPTLFGDLVSGVATLVKDAIDSFSSLLGGGNSPPTT